MTRRNVIGAVLVCAAALSTGAAARALAARQESEGAAQRMALSEFKKLFDQNGVVVLDIRGEEAYRSGHIPGSISVPLETVSSRASEWKSARKPIVTYCS